MYLTTLIRLEVIYMQMFEILAGLFLLIMLWYKMKDFDVELYYGLEIHKLT